MRCFSLMSNAALLDAHVHLPAYPDPEGVVAAAGRMGVGLVSVTESAGQAPLSLALKERHKGLRCFLGVHPSEAGKPSGGLEELGPLWGLADGVGEIGLDPKYSQVGKTSPQMDLFVAQVEVAERMRKPLQVHTRDAEGSCLDVLEGRSLGPVLFHWYEGEESLGRALAIPRSFVSFGPAVLYSKKLARIARRCPLEAVLTESDGPVGFAALGGACGPGLVPSVAFRLAEVWGKSLGEAVERLSLNATAYLR